MGAEKSRQRSEKTPIITYIFKDILHQITNS